MTHTPAKATRTATTMAPVEENPVAEVDPAGGAMFIAAAARQRSAGASHSVKQNKYFGSDKWSDFETPD